MGALWDSKWTLEEYSGIETVSVWKHPYLVFHFDFIFVFVLFCSFESCRRWVPWPQIPFPAQPRSWDFQKAVRASESSQRNPIWCGFNCRVLKFIFSFRNNWHILVLIFKILFLSKGIFWILVQNRKCDLNLTGGASWIHWKNIGWEFGDLTSRFGWATQLYCDLRQATWPLERFLKVSLFI